MPEINAIPGQMNRLFFNLISNSLKFSNPAGPVEINICLQPVSEKELAERHLDLNVGYIKIEFCDNGIGFKQEYAEQIFSLFKRLHGKSEYEGTGIGLGLCLKIVQRHKGAIWAESGSGQGATFHILIPRNGGPVAGE